MVVLDAFLAEAGFIAPVSQLRPFSDERMIDA